MACASPREARTKRSSSGESPDNEKEQATEFVLVQINQQGAVFLQRPVVNPPYKPLFLRAVAHLKHHRSPFNENGPSAVPLAGALWPVGCARSRGSCWWW